MKMLTLILAVTAAGLLASPARVKKLEKERIAALKAQAEVARKLAVGGRAPLEAALETRLLLLQAELDDAEKDTNRIALYDRCVEALKEYEDLAVARRQAAMGTEATTLEIRARRLEVEIRLEQARAKETKGSSPVRNRPQADGP